MQKKLLLTLIAGCFAASFAQAQPPAVSQSKTAHSTEAQPHKGEQRTPAEYFSRLDKNQDGFISRDEAKGHQHLAAHFDKIDANSDGKLSKQELEQWGKDMRAKTGERFEEEFKAADTNGDGMLSKEEVAASKMPGLAAHFDTLDNNKDGKLSKQELKAGYQAMKAGKGAGRHHGKGYAPGTGHGSVDHFKAADYNADGVVTKAEALSYASDLFDKLDQDGDGKLTRENIRQGYMGVDKSQTKDKQHGENFTKRLRAADKNQDSAKTLEKTK